MAKYELEFKSPFDPEDLVRIMMKKAELKLDITDNLRVTRYESSFEDVVWSVYQKKRSFPRGIKDLFKGMLEDPSLVMQIHPIVTNYVENLGNGDFICSKYEIIVISELEKKITPEVIDNITENEIPKVIEKYQKTSSGLIPYLKNSKNFLL